MGLSAGPAASKGLPVAEVSFFIFGALFTFVLVAAILLLLGQAAPPPAAIRAPDGGGGHADPFQTPRAARREATSRSGPPRPRPQIAGPSQSTQAHRQAEAYRIASSLDQAERTLSRIARGPERAAAKIATQALRRLSVASEPPKARLDFARQRLELLSLRADPVARLAARAALGAMT
jgi:hypothetical protein